MRYQGRITTWKDEKGFGFITSDTDGEQIFVHITAFVNRRRRPVESEYVTYERVSGRNGGFQAQAVVFADEDVVRSRVSLRRIFFLALAACFLLFVASMVVTDRLPGAVLALYGTLSLMTFLIYAKDKSAALRNRWRTQESSLHTWALFGGWPGALVAQQLLRHKSSKSSFQVMFWFTVIVNCGALGWLFTPRGRAMLGRALEMAREVLHILL